MKQRIKAFAALGEYLRVGGDELDAAIRRAMFDNPWFTEANIRHMLSAIAEEMLLKSKLETWVSAYPAPASEGRRVGLVLAGNIPLVGFHDVLSVLVMGHKAVIKPSEKDTALLKHLLEKLVEIAPEMSGQYEFVDRLAGFEAVIATGSNNTTRYFEAYFGKVPHIIRGHRNGVAVLDGNETTEELYALGEDVFRYFGLGCRNVSKFYVPEGYNFEPLLEQLHEHNEVILHAKYKHNFDYNYALYIINRLQYVANGCIIMIEEKSIASRIAACFFEYYTDRNALAAELETRTREIQCIVSREPVGSFKHFRLGETQRPALNDYADNIDTLAFLAALE